LFDFKEIREGRKVVAVEFRIKSKATSNPNDYDGMAKRDLIKSIQSRMHDRTTETIHAVELFKYHRIILVELIERFEKGAFENVVIQHPKAFFKWHLDEINNMFDQERLFKEKKDY
jgi:plasmid replication initiation protein